MMRQEILRGEQNRAQWLREQIPLVAQEHLRPMAPVR